MVSITQVTDPIQIAVAQELVREYFSWFFALIPGSESDPTFRGWEAELETIPVDAFMHNARVLGYKFAVLDSHISMTKAHDIYKKSGFKVVEAPPDFPEELRQSVIFMRCVL